jgi:hypothetical protein
MIAITRFDEDHASTSADLFDNVRVAWVLRNKSVSLADIKTLKTEEAMGPGTERLVTIYQQIARGGPCRGTTRNVLIRRNGGRTGFQFHPGSWGSY